MPSTEEEDEDGLSHVSIVFIMVTSHGDKVVFLFQQFPVFHSKKKDVEQFEPSNTSQNQPKQNGKTYRK